MLLLEILAHLVLFVLLLVFVIIAQSVLRGIYAYAVLNHGIKTDKCYEALVKLHIVKDVEEVIDKLLINHLKFPNKGISITFTEGGKMKGSDCAGYFSGRGNVIFLRKWHVVVFWGMGYRDALVHEYVHARQWDGFGGYFDDGLPYLDQLSEVEAYTIQLVVNRGLYKVRKMDFNEAREYAHGLWLEFSSHSYTLKENPMFSGVGEFMTHPMMGPRSHLLSEREKEGRE